MITGAARTGRAAAYAQGRADGYDRLAPTAAAMTPARRRAYQAGYADGRLARKVFERRVTQWERGVK